MKSDPRHEDPAGFSIPGRHPQDVDRHHFEPHGADASRVRVMSMGFGDDEESERMRAFFDRGTAYTLEQLVKRFAAGGR